MTYLQLVNATLRRLRRQEVTTVTADYSKLIGDLVNLAKREAEDSWDWLSLMTTTPISTLVGSDTYTLTGWGERYWVRQVHDTTNDRALCPMTEAQANKNNDFPGGTTGEPQYWRINGKDGSDPTIQLWPEPLVVTSISVYGKVSQADLSASADVLTVPSYPVLTGAYLRALDERGEDGGTQAQMAARDYRQAIADAIAQDNSNRGAGISSDWKVA